MTQSNDAGRIVNETERFDRFCGDWNKRKNCNQRFVGDLKLKISRRILHFYYQAYCALPGERAWFCSKYQYDILVLLAQSEILGAMIDTRVSDSFAYTVDIEDMAVNMLDTIAKMKSTLPVDRRWLPMVLQIEVLAMELYAGILPADHPKKLP